MKRLLCVSYYNVTKRACDFQSSASFCLVNFYFVICSFVKAAFYQSSFTRNGKNTKASIKGCSRSGFSTGFITGFVTLATVCVLFHVSMVSLLQPLLLLFHFCVFLSQLSELVWRLAEEISLGIKAIPIFWSSGQRQ